MTSVICINQELNIFEDNDGFTVKSPKMLRNLSRTEAFDKLKNPAKFLYKTRMCNRKDKHNKDTCPFAHHESELRNIRCFFGKNCKHKDTTCKLQH